jgi:Response regulator containing CheY-like receiver, AAA-type ATPase, and DNA-binding domains
MRLRAIVFDDEYAMRTLIGEILEERGYEVHVSSEPFSSSIFLESKCDCSVDTPRLNIFITDINIPNMTGLKFIKHQKKKRCKIQNIAIMSGG